MLNEIAVNTPTEVATILRGLDGSAAFVFERENEQISVKLRSPEKGRSA